MEVERWSLSLEIASSNPSQGGLHFFLPGNTCFFFFYICAMSTDKIKERTAISTYCLPFKEKYMTQQWHKLNEVGQLVSELFRNGVRVLPIVIIFYILKETGRDKKSD